MRRITAVVTTAAALTVLMAGTAAADAGGTPNGDAITQTGNGQPQGRKGHGCPVPGDTFSANAKDEGPSHIMGAPNGQFVKALCTPAGS